MIKQNLLLPFELTQSETTVLNNRLAEFKELGKKKNEEWFSELCFCILTANSQAQKAIDIQKHIGIEGFINHTEENLAKIIRSFGHRFHNTKAKYIVCAREYINIKDCLRDMPSYQAREFLVQNIKGLGYKESSHFLRNVGYDDFAIIDRHIIKFLYKYGVISKIPNVITKKAYLELEMSLKAYDINLSRLDLMIWCHMTGTILK